MELTHRCGNCGQEWRNVHLCPDGTVARHLPDIDSTTLTLRNCTAVHQLQDDNAALRERVAKLERVREAAEDYVDCINKFGASTHTVRGALRAALDDAKEPK